MGEVIISAKTAVRVHGDTTSYRVDSFITDPLANTEDVLKRLPGVEVSRDGKVTIQGKEVNKLFINGKEYFADNLRNVLQNLPAEILEKIQVADYRDEDANFTGQKDNTTEKVINLQFKKKYNGGIYGRAGAGYGTKDRYQGGLFANYMNGGAIHITAMGQANNTGMANIGDDDGNAGNTAWTSPGVRTEQGGNINFSYDDDDKFRINGTYSFANNNNYLERSTFRTTYLPGDSILLQLQDNTQTSKSRQHSLSLRSRYKISKLTTWRSSIRVRSGQQNSVNRGDDITYVDEQADALDFERLSETTRDRTRNTLGFNNTLMQKFNKEGRRLLVRININYSGSNTDGNVSNLNTYYNPPNSNQILNLTDERNNNYTANAALYYTEPINENNSIIAKYGYRHQFSDNDRDVSVENNGIYIEDTTQSRGYENTNINHTIGLTYQYSNEQLRAGAGFDAEPYVRKSLPTSGAAAFVEQRGANYFPKLFARYMFSKSSNISMSYNGSISPPTLEQLQPIPDYTDSLNIFIGNPSLTPELNNNVSLRFSTHKIKTGRNAWVSLGGGWVNNKIINNTELTGSRRTTTPVNANGNYRLNSAASLTEPFIKKVLKGTFSLRAYMTNNVTIVNGVERQVANYTLSPSFRLTCYTDKWYEGSLNYSYRWNKVDGTTQNNEQNQQADNVLQAHDVTHDGTFILPKGFRLSYYLSYMVNKGLAQSFQQEFFLANLMLNKTFDKPKGLSIRVHAFDIFNNYPTVQRSITDNYFEDTEVNRIGSYFMFSLIYKFTSFSEKKDNDD